MAKRLSATAKGLRGPFKKLTKDLKPPTKKPPGALPHQTPKPPATPKPTSAPPAMSGPVVVRAPKNATPDQIAQVKRYVAGSNRALKAGQLSPTGKVSTKGTLRDQASAAARAERAANPAAYTGKHAAHVPDTTWTGKPTPPSWDAQDGRVNTSVGGQSNAYPVGFTPTKFVYGGRMT